MGIGTPHGSWKLRLPSACRTIARELAATGERHLGLVFTSARSLPRGAGTIGRYVDELDAFLRERREDDALADLVHWLGSR